MVKSVKSFQSDEDGIALIFVAIMVPVLVGFSALAIDYTRASGLHNDLQSSANALALAMAAELDGKPDAIVRATNVLTGTANSGGQILVTNNPFKMADPSSGAALSAGDVAVHYLSTIPPNDADPVTSADYTTDPTEAVFVEISVNPTAFRPIFPYPGFNVVVDAVAGNQGEVVCAYVPMFICDPFRIFSGGVPTGIGIEAAFKAGLVTGKSMNLLIASQGSDPIAGNFGFLRPSADNGYSEGELASDIAHSGKQGCLNRRNLYTQTGTLSNKVRDGFGTRFDLWGSAGGFDKTDPTLAVPADVRKGYTFKSAKKADYCNLVAGTDPTKWMAMPADRTMDSDYPSIGTGDWDSATFLSVNHLAGLPTTSRYALYLAESSAQIATASSGGEIGTPKCSSIVQSDADRADPNKDRRLMNAAIVDCTDPDNLGALKGQSGTTMTAEEFGRFFLIQPAGNSILVEGVDITGPNGGGTLANFAKPDVELYR